jgi:antitoxin (DNA-binding transcriptional repressor) of toxin-antitoxin stability system
MATRIPLRELKNQCSAIVRRAEAGESFEVIVDGRLCAVLSPARPPGPRTFVPVAEVLEMMEAIERLGPLGDIRGEMAAGLDDTFEDPYTRYAGWMDA